MRAAAIGISLVMATILCIVVDLVLSQFSWFGLIADPGFRIADPIIHHGFKAKECTWDDWGPYYHRLCTNSLGFKDQTAREVSKTGAVPRVLFMGDSFTEAIGMRWEDSFVGLFAEAHPRWEVLNAGVSSYAPAIHYAKLRSLLERGYRFDHVVVAIDISDIQDETFYDVTSDGRAVDSRTNVAKDRGFIRFAKRNLKGLFPAARFIERVIYGPPEWESHREGPFDSSRGAWTYADPKTLESEYAPLGVEGGIERARIDMDRIHSLLQSEGIPVSVLVYPWPNQLKYDRIDSLQAQIWRRWCAGKCAHFIDAFPTFFAYRDAHPDSWYQDLFIQGDTHFNEAGNRLMATELEVLKEVGR